MKATYQDFLSANPNCNQYAQNSDAIALFKLINTDDLIIKMIDSCDRGKPALAGCVSEIEAYFDSLAHPTLDLKDSFTRTAVGRMIKAILEPFGYRPTTQKSLQKECHANYFVSASCYSLVAPATMRVVKRIEAV